MKTLNRVLCFILTFILVFALGACGKTQEGEAQLPEEQEQTELLEPEPESEPEPLTEYVNASLTGNFNPYTAQGDDKKVVELISSTLGNCTTHTTQEKDGYYGYFTTYVIHDGLCFSNGQELTAEDIIYSLTVAADPMYVVLEPERSNIAIYGTEEYRAGYRPLYTIILSDLQANRSVPVDEENTEDDDETALADGDADANEYPYTAEDVELFNSALERAGLLFVDEIVDYCVDRYADEKALGAVGVSAEKVRSDENYRIAFAMWCWQFASGLNDDGVFCTLGGGEYNLSVQGPTVYDFWQVIFNTYGYNMSDQGIDYEKIDQGIDELLRQVIAADYPTLCRCVSVETDETSYEYVYGIKKEDDRTITVHVSSLDSALNSVYIVPDQAYGELERGNLINMVSSNEVFGPGAYRLESSSAEETVLIKQEGSGLTGRPADIIVFKTESNAETE